VTTDPTYRSKTVFLAAALALGAAATHASPAIGQITWLNPEDGDVVNVSTAHVLDPGMTTIGISRSLEKSDRHGEILFHRFRVEYGLRSNFSVGVSSRHLEQNFGDEFKKGLGDSNVFAKLRLPVTPRHSSLSFAIRQSLTLPTGFEEERNELAPFTTRHNDYTAQLSGSFRARGIAVHMSPGVILPGGDAPTFLSFGSAVELDDVLPFGLDIAGEYFTRWNMVEEDFETDVSLEAERALFWNLGATVGVKRRLLESQTVDPEVRLGLTFGQSHSSPRGPFPRHQPDAVPVRLRIDPISSLVEDPYGVLGLLDSSFANQGPRYDEGVSVFVQSPRTSAVENSTGDGDYRLQMRLLDFREGEIEGFKIPKIFKAPKAETRLFVEAVLFGHDDLPLSRPVVIEARVSQGLGAQLIPMTTRIRQMVVPDEVRNGLREDVVKKMTEIILDQTTEVISERIENERRQQKAAREAFAESRPLERPDPNFELQLDPELESEASVESGTTTEPEASFESEASDETEAATIVNPESTPLDLADEASNLAGSVVAPTEFPTPLPEETDAP